MHVYLDHPFNIFSPQFFSALALIFNGQNCAAVASAYQVLFENIFTQ